MCVTQLAKSFWIAAPLICVVAPSTLCNKCALMIIQSGMTKFVYYNEDICPCYEGFHTNEERKGDERREKERASKKLLDQCKGVLQVSLLKSKHYCSCTNSTQAYKLHQNPSVVLCLSRRLKYAHLDEPPSAELKVLYKSLSPDSGCRKGLLQHCDTSPSIISWLGSDIYSSHLL